MSLLITLLTFSFIIGLLSIIYKKTFFLSILLGLEIVLLNLITFNFLISISLGQPSFLPLSLFLIALAAIEASLGISIITLISRNFSESSLNNINLLKN
uniref:NADH-ubiquinone oxidoreductase chain 4L n=1 Tax=Ophiomonas sp. TaxID=3135530 RepID=A0AAU6PWY9_9ECHI